MDRPERVETAVAHQNGILNLRTRQGRVEGGGSLSLDHDRRSRQGSRLAGQ